MHTQGEGNKTWRRLLTHKLPSDLHCLQINTNIKKKKTAAVSSVSWRVSQGWRSVVRLPGQSAEGPVVLHRVLVGPLTHVMHSSVADGEPLLCDVLHQVDPQRDLLVIITGSERKGDLAVSGVHHVLIPLGKVVGDALQ